MRRYFPLLILFFIILSNCTNDKPLPGGYELLEREGKSDLVVTTLRATETSTFWKTPIAGERATLLLGQQDDVSSFITFRFLIYSSDAGDTASINSATLRMYQRVSSDYNADSTAVSVYAINPELSWSEVTMNLDTLDGFYDESQTYGTFNVGADSATFVEYPINPAVVNKWIDEGVNQGIVLKFDNSSFLSEFYSSDTVVDSLRPRLHVTFTKQGGEADTLDLETVSDASVIQNNSIVPENELQTDIDRLVVGNGTGYQSIVKFDLSSLPDNANIHQALLEFKVDEMNSNTSGEEMAISAVILTDSLVNPADFGEDDYGIAATAFGFDNVDFFNYAEATANSVINGFFQLWINGLLENNGLLLKSDLPGVNNSFLSFYTGAEDSTLAPTVRITYSLPPTSRFETDN